MIRRLEEWLLAALLVRFCHRAKPESIQQLGVKLVLRGLGLQGHAGQVVGVDIQKVAKKKGEIVN